MNIEIYINGQPIENYSQEELAEIKKTITRNAMKAAGYVPANTQKS